MKEKEIMGLFTKKYLSNTRKPKGFMGKKMVSVMNEGTHQRLSDWGMQYVSFDAGAHVLDMGCGGGANIQKMLGKVSDGHVSGADYSDISVAKSREVNKDAISEGRCDVVRADVTKLPFEEGTFDLITAFETVYFWPDLNVSFREIARVLKKGGVFMITNESTGTDETSVHFHNIIDGMNLYTPEELRKYMENAGLEAVDIHQDEKEPWICVTGRRPL